MECLLAGFRGGLGLGKELFLRWHRRVPFEPLAQERRDGEIETVRGNEKHAKSGRDEGG